jgi:DNA-binding GntR family transcriptional regulator
MADGAIPRVRPRLRRRPLADEVRDQILGEFIRSGAVPAGERLPSETELSGLYGVSRVTVRAAIRSLQEAGLVAARQGVGTIAMPQSETILSGIDQLSSIDSFARDLGASVGTEDLELEELVADEELAARLEIRPGTPTLVVRRVKTYAGDRVAWIVDLVPETTLPSEVTREEFRGSVLDVMLAHEELGVEYADCEIVPVALDTEVARQLGVRRGTPALYMDEITRNRDGHPLEWGQAWLLPRHFHFVLRRRRALAG